ERAERAAAGVGDEARARIDRADLAIPQAPQLEQPLLLPREIRAARGVARIGGPRQIETVRRAEVPLAVLAVAHPRSGPAIAEYAVHAIPRRNLFVHLRH